MDDIFRFISDMYGDTGILIRAFDEMGQEKQMDMSDEEKELRKLASDDRRLMKFLVYYAVYVDLERRLPDLINEDSKKETLHLAVYPVEWTGNKDNKNDFVQLIYGLHQAGYLNKGKGEVTKIVESLATTLKVGLSKNWQSNLSSSIHKSKRDYEPPVFNKIKQAYSRHADDLVSAKKTK